MAGRQGLPLVRHRPAVGQDGAGGVVHRGQQVHGAPLAVCSWWAAGAAQRLTVDADRLPPSLGLAIMAVAVAQPGADHRGHGLGVKPTKRTADGGLGRDGPGSGASRRAPSAARIGWEVSVAHSAIAVIDCAPASTAAAARARMATSGWRRPARALGSGMAAK